MGNQTKIIEAIQAAENELHDVQRQLDQLRRLEHRAKQLEDFIAAGMILLGEVVGDAALKPQETSSVPERTATAPRPKNRKKRTVADYIRILFEEKKKPIPLQEITQVLLDRKWVTGRWAREVIRTALKRGKDFERIALGVYALKQWPNELKRWPPSESYLLSQPVRVEKASQNGSVGEVDTEETDQLDIHSNE